MMGKQMMGGKEKELEVSPKDMKEVKSLHDKIMALADKYDMGMEELIEKCCHDMEEDYSEEGSSDEDSGAVDKMKVKFIIGKMRPQGEE